VGVNLRGLSESQLEIVLQCERRRSCATKRVIEFNQLAHSAIGKNEPVVPTPTTDMISSFLSNRKKGARNGVAVGMTALQDLAKFAEDHQWLSVPLVHISSFDLKTLIPESYRLVL
jgi:hypothetical protein